MLYQQFIRSNGHRMRGLILSDMRDAVLQVRRSPCAVQRPAQRAAPGSDAYDFIRPATCCT